MYAYIYYGIFLSCFQTICSDNLMKSPFYKYIVTIFLFFYFFYIFIYLRAAVGLLYLKKAQASLVFYF